MEGFGKPIIMRQSICPALFAAVALLALPGPALAAAGSVNDFRLPQGGSQTAPPAPERQGPVAPDVPESQAPRATPAPTATPVPPQSTPPGPARPATVQPIATPRPAGTVPAAQRPATARSVAAPTPAPISTPSARGAEPGAAVTPEPIATPATPPLPIPQPLPAPPLASAEADTSGWLPWALGAAALLAALALAWLFLRQRIGPERPQQTPVLERPRAASALSPTPEPEPAPIVPLPPRDPLHVTLVPVRLSLTLVNAVLTWEVELANQGNAPLTGLAVAADMISAHADLSLEDRSSGPAAGVEAMALGQLALGERRMAGGDIRLPFPHIVPIWHGEIALLMPLLRLRISADGMAPVTRIFLVGQPSPTDATTLQPFRLDLGPRVYPDLAQRVFA